MTKDDIDNIKMTASTTTTMMHNKETKTVRLQGQQHGDSHNNKGQHKHGREKKAKGKKTTSYATC